MDLLIILSSPSAILQVFEIIPYWLYVSRNRTTPIFVYIVQHSKLPFNIISYLINPLLLCLPISLHNNYITKDTDLKEFLEIKIVKWTVSKQSIYMNLFMDCFASLYTSFICWTLCWLILFRIEWRGI